MLSSKKSRLRKIKTWEEQGNDDAVRGLVKFIAGESDASVKAEAVRTLGEMRSPEAFAPLLEALKDEDPEVRAAAARAVGESGRADAAPPLILALNDPDEVVRAFACESLGRVGDAASIEPLAGRLKDREWNVSALAAAALARIGDDRAIMPLLGWMERVFTSTAKKLTASEKLAMARDAAVPLFYRLDDAKLQGLTTNVMLQVNVKSWEVTDPQTYEYGWVTSSCKNPIWKPLQDELERRKSLASESLVGAETQRFDADSMDDTIGAPEEEQATESYPLTEAPAAAQSERPEKSPTDSDEFDELPSPSRVGEPERADLDLTPPQPEGIVADFLGFLRERGLRSLVLVGGAVRDTAMGRAPRNLDVALQVRMPDDLQPDPTDPVDWNMQFAENAATQLAALAEALGATPADLIAGKAAFSSGAGSLPVSFVGPFLMEDIRNKRTGMKVEQRLHRTVSRLGLVANAVSDRVAGLAADATVNRMWIDNEGKWRGDWRQALECLEDRTLHVDWDASRVSATDLFRILAMKHSLGFSLSDATIALLDAASARVNLDRSIAAEDFAREDAERTMASADLDDLVEELELLNMTGFLMDVLDPSKLLKINTTLSRRESDKRKGLQERERGLAQAEADQESKRAALEEARRRFAEHYDRLDRSKSTKNDVEVRLRAEIDKLRAADEAGREAAIRLNEATRNFRHIAAGEMIDPTVIREHREALADKKAKDELVDTLRHEVEGLRATLKQRHAAIGALQEEMEGQGAALETASREFEAAQGRRAEAEKALDRVKAELTLSPEARRERLRRAPLERAETRRAATG